MGYWIRSGQTPFLVKEDLTAKSESCFPYSPLAKIEEWWEDDWVSLTDGLVHPRLPQVALISAVGSHLAEKMSPKQTNRSRPRRDQQMQRISSAWCGQRQAGSIPTCLVPAAPPKLIKDTPGWLGINTSDQQQRNQQELGMWMMAWKWGDTTQESKQSGDRDRVVAKIQNRHSQVLEKLPWRWAQFISVHNSSNSPCLHVHLHFKNMPVLLHPLLAPEPKQSSQYMKAPGKKQDVLLGLLRASMRVETNLKLEEKGSKRTKRDLVHYSKRGRVVNHETMPYNQVPQFEVWKQTKDCQKFLNTSIK